MLLTYTVGVSSPTNLWQLVQDYAETNEPTFLADIPTFVQAAETRIYETVDLPILRKNVTGNFSTSNKYLTTPTDWISTYSLAVVDGTGTYTFLINKDVNYIREAYPDPTVTGLPQHYGVFDSNTFVVGPTPDQSYVAELHYKAYPVSIVTATTTWLGNNFGELLLYGALREAYTFQKGEADMMAKYEALYMEQLALLKQVGDGAERRDAYRSGQARVPVQ